MTGEEPDPAHPRLVIAAPQGRSGKTTVTLGLAAALVARGLAVHPFKKGPDYIDPSWLSAAAGRPCRSLDPFFMPSPAALRAAFFTGVRSTGTERTLPHNVVPTPSSGASRGRGLGSAPPSPVIALIEGNHGLFDSLEAPDDAPEGSGSTAALARALAAPVVLVLNASRTGRSAAAIVLGCLQFEPGTPIAGVVLNRVASPRHEEKIRRAIESHCGIPVLGAVPSDPALAVPDRHLGLIPAGEEDRGPAVIDACRTAVEAGCSVDALIELARSAPALSAPGLAGPFAFPSAPVARIGVFRDRAFTFYYYENLEALADAGAALVPIDSFREAELPRVDALYIGGGFPEIFMEELSANKPLLASVRGAVEQGMPVYAECGGLMYLARSIRWGDRRAEMAGALPVDIEMTPRPQGHGYVLARVAGANPFFETGALLRGHEFHNSRLVNISAELPLVYELVRGRGMGGGRDAIAHRSILASYTHLHAAGAPAWATGFVRRAAGKAPCVAFASVNGASEPRATT